MSAVHTRSRSGTAAVGALLVLALILAGSVTDQARAGVAPRDKMLALTNQDRTEHDKKALKLNARLSRYAARHSAEMAESGLFHTSEKALRRKLDGLEWSMAGENIGTGSSLRSMQKAFMHSELHRENILNEGYDHAATGVFEGSDGTVWVTVIFYG